MNNVLILLAGIVGAVGSYWIGINLNKGATMGAAVITLLSGLIFPYINPEIGPTLAVVATSGAYAGMISKKNAPHIWEMVIVGAIVGMVSILATSTYIGVGGKLGTMAAIACFIWIGIKKTFKIDVPKEMSATKELRGHNINTRSSQSY